MDNPTGLYTYASDKLTILSKDESSRIWLTNKTPVLVRPHQPFILPLGVFVDSIPGHAILLTGKTDRPVTCHVGLIDPGYTGELKLILNNSTPFNQTLFPEELQIYVMAFMFSTPLILDNNLLSRPHYSEDAGYDLLSPFDFYVYPLTSFSILIPHPCPAPKKMFVPVVLGRSGIAISGVTVSATVWNKDQLKIRLFSHAGETQHFSKGSRICQVVFMHKRHVRSKYCHPFDCFQLSPSLFFSWAQVSFKNLGERTAQHAGIHDGSPAPPSVTNETRPVRDGNGFGSSGM
ncbi:deoxyuridine triphosphatase [Common bottlenose dolphin gammaherpesvirus 1 strain Sarasota]|uniref:Deoxyuridine triphosphatase n=1 Tax=Common bottlenose dolphin gammaherpesvirus 1 strain Sarasota TaxID=2022783 RepID=A0A1Z1NE40_9GAMA|nr:deoxyuridine triphosphatase [Common bottlenose dolphin gammaherpesvirus 1 strain Sarasota]ARW78116.1 deoxyuridine triphosphatase [Common bottlenose dolphin gammaherpesvirus 1 strain Sarasota]